MTLVTKEYTQIFTANKKFVNGLATMVGSETAMQVYAEAVSEGYNAAQKSKLTPKQITAIVGGVVKAWIETNYEVA